MPKKNKRRVVQRKMVGPEEAESHSDGENSTDERSSFASLMDEMMLDDAVSGDGQDTETSEQEREVLEDRLSECIDGLLVKSAPRRKKSLEGLKQIMSMKYCTEFLEKSKATVTESLVKCLRKGKGEEQTTAAWCLALLAIQLGEEVSHMYPDLHTTLATMLADTTASPRIRAQCATTMAMCRFIYVITNGGNDVEVNSEMMLMEAVFRTACQQKANGGVAQGGPEMAEMMSSCVDAWSLLLTQLPGFFLRDKAKSYLGMLGDLLRSSDTELRIAAGEAIALLYELNREIDEDFDEKVANTEMLCERLKELSKESAKHKARSVRREQRARFRDILLTVQDRDMAEEMVTTGRKEEVILCDWSTKVQYAAFCNTLQSGVFTHLTENLILRDLFDVGGPLPAGSKLADKLKYAKKNCRAVDKAKTKQRLKCRDKRSAVQGF